VLFFIAVVTACAEDPGFALDRSWFDYELTCEGAVPASGEHLDAAPPSEDCSRGVWPDLDPTVAVCPTFSSEDRYDPASDRVLPVVDSRRLPVEIPVSESGSFRRRNAGSSPETLKVVAWNLEYTGYLDEQLRVLTTHPDLRDADVYLLSEVDRCSSRNDFRRAARELAAALQGDYAYAIEYVELDLGRRVGGDTGQAIISRRPLSGASVTCHSQVKDWLSSSTQPRLGQRVSLHADVPVGDTSVRLFAVHFESEDILGDRRTVQVRETLAAVAATACERPTIVAGDFNAWYATGPEHANMRAAGFRDAVARAGDQAATHDAGLRLDYIWSRGFEVVSGGVATDVGSSDHRPVWATLRLREGQPSKALAARDASSRASSASPQRLTSAMPGPL